MKRSKFIVAVAFLVAVIAGCASPCVQLAEKICDCQDTQTDRDTCNSNVSARAGEVTITSDDEDTCDKLIDSCACHEINTAQGKVNCGLAR